MPQDANDQKEYLCIVNSENRMVEIRVFDNLVAEILKESRLIYPCFQKECAFEQKVVWHREGILSVQLQRLYEKLLQISTGLKEIKDVILSIKGIAYVS